jgi:predicted nucleotidyltransferase
MDREEVLTKLRADEPRLRAQFGVRSLALFGSVGRGEATGTSDVDLLVEYEPGRRVGLFHHVGTALHLEELLGVPKVDLVIWDAVIDDLKEIIYGKAIDVFGPAQVEVPRPAHP